ncbi:glycoside hydrolase [Linderina pennispora]|uniref:alpha-1,2-Mannosidase n=1 Tax=Linderina pennispora TaxID=61395 RepID=A0A1Y1VY55_9FUNG|nr:glycoside hydrolase [Linderina pennispora]ORX65946.1 glycoside hydrolase [Linderina pennispora]
MLMRVSLRKMFFSVGAIVGTVYLLNIYGILRSDMLRSGHSRVNYERQQAVRDAMKHAWSGYRQFAFGHDEFQPLTRTFNSKWGGWGITLVDALDTLKLMGLDEEYSEAKRLDFQMQVFEMTIRALGGLLGAYELDNDPMLLKKATEVGDVLLWAYDTPTGLPASRLDINNRLLSGSTLLCIAEGGTMQLEYQKLAQLTGNDTYRRMAERASNALENGQRKYKGLYPTYIDIHSGQYVNNTALSVGAMADSFYEYQLKQYILNGKREQKYKDWYVTSSEAVKEKLVRTAWGMKYIGHWDYNESLFVQEMQHLTCFYPGLLALGARVLDRPEDLRLAEEITETCYLSYRNMPTGLGPEKSIFVLYRITGDDKYREWGWNIFMAIEKYARTPYGYAAVRNVGERLVQESNWEDSMESFFLAETLKYLYLLFSPPNLISLDEYVLNTEAHPFKIIK